MKLVLHVGPNKSGSTLIQNVLRENEETLVRHGIWYRKIDEYFANHHSFYRSIAEADGAKANQLAADFIADAQSLHCSTLIVSHENLWDLVRDTGAMDTLKQSLLENTLFDEVTCVVLSRSREAWFRSYCLQLVRNGSISQLRSLVYDNGLYTLLAQALDFFSAYNLQSVALNESAWPNFLATVDNSIDNTIIAVNPDGPNYRNPGPKRGLVGDLILGLASVVYSSTHPGQHINSVTADSFRRSIVKAIDEDLGATASLNAEIEKLVWSTYVQQAAKNLPEQYARTLDRYGFNG
jgi:hypothetical protein